jgi:hypothetical protein
LTGTQVVLWPPHRRIIIWRHESKAAVDVGTSVYPSNFDASALDQSAQVGSLLSVGLPSGRGGCGGVFDDVGGSAFSGHDVQVSRAVVARTPQDHSAVG